MDIHTLVSLRAHEYAISSAKRPDTIYAGEQEFIAMCKAVRTYPVEGSHVYRSNGDVTFIGLRVLRVFKDSHLHVCRTGAADA